MHGLLIIITTQAIESSVVYNTQITENTHLNKMVNNANVFFFLNELGK